MSTFLMWRNVSQVEVLLSQLMCWLSVFRSLDVFRLFVDETLLLFRFFV